MSRTVGLTTDQSWANSCNLRVIGNVRTWAAGGAAAELPGFPGSYADPAGSCGRKEHNLAMPSMDLPPRSLRQAPDQRFQGPAPDRPDVPGPRQPDDGTAWPPRERTATAA